MERPLRDREREVLRRLLEVDTPENAALRESLDHLVVDGECGCGCESFGVRDTRFPEQEHRLQEWAGATSRDGETHLLLFVGPEGRLKYLDILMPNQGRLPEPDELEVFP